MEGSGHGSWGPRADVLLKAMTRCLGGTDVHQRGPLLRMLPTEQPSSE